MTKMSSYILWCFSPTPVHHTSHCSLYLRSYMQKTNLSLSSVLCSVRLFPLFGDRFKFSVFPSYLSTDNRFSSCFLILQLNLLFTFLAKDLVTLQWAVWQSVMKMTRRTHRACQIKCQNYIRLSFPQIFCSSAVTEYTCQKGFVGFR